ncbi:hypothetical protein G6F59_018674 [Rhizopus arrhizus]|nr:hypothetical protein G6F59_018674 [Rhizopus arrhizus]
MIICSATRPARGPRPSEQAPTASSPGTTSISSRRSRRLGPTPMAVITAICESRYRRAMASSRPSISASGRISGR